MENQKKVINQISKDLLSQDQNTIQKALDKTRSKGNEFLIDPLIKLYTITKSEKIKEEVKAIFSELKNEQSLSYLLPHLEDDRNDVKELVLFSL